MQWDDLRLTAALFGIALSSLALPALAGQPLETETARLPAKGQGSAEFGLEYLTGKDGRELIAPILIRYGITDRLQLTLEPVPYRAINPKVGRSLHGIGDTEVILTYMLAHETAQRPALALAGEVKFPTAKSPSQGTGVADYRMFGIASKRVGRFDLHANAGFTIVGEPKGAKLSNIVDYAVAAEYALTPRSTLMAEVFGESPVGKSSTLSVQEETTVVTGMVGGRFRLSDRAQLWLAVTYDSEGEAVLKPGLAFKF